MAHSRVIGLLRNRWVGEGRGGDTERAVVRMPEVQGSSLNLTDTSHSCDQM
jgi:hypothetical protein